MLIRRILEYIQGLHTPDLMVAQACMMSHYVCAWAAVPTGPKCPVSQVRRAAAGGNTPKSPEHRQIGRDIDLINLK